MVFISPLLLIKSVESIQLVVDTYLAITYLFHIMSSLGVNQSEMGIGNHNLRGAGNTNTELTRLV